MNTVQIPGVAEPSQAAGMSCVNARVSSSSRRPLSSQSGLTLIEVTISVGVLAISLLGILGGLFYAYKTAAGVRYHDNAHVIVKSLGDQFLVLPAQTTAGGFKPMWTNTIAPTGVGLSWDDFDGTVTSAVTGTTSGLSLHLGANTGNPVIAVVTRDVRYLNASGQIVTSIASSSAGYLLLGEFTIAYTYQDRPYTQTLSLVRAWP